MQAFIARWYYELVWTGRKLCIFSEHTASIVLFEFSQNLDAEYLAQGLEYEIIGQVCFFLNRVVTCFSVIFAENALKFLYVDTQEPFRLYQTLNCTMKMWIHKNGKTKRKQELIFPSNWTFIRVTKEKFWIRWKTNKNTFLEIGNLLIPQWCSHISQTYEKGEADYKNIVLSAVWRQSAQS